jgi:hypothetical protein
MQHENDGIHEVLEHTIHVGTGILNDHLRAAADRRAIEARQQTAALNATTQVADAQHATLKNGLGAELQEVAKLVGLSNALPAAAAVLSTPSRGSSSRRPGFASEQPLERERGR